MPRRRAADRGRATGPACRSRKRSWSAPTRSGCAARELVRVGPDRRAAGDAGLFSYFNDDPANIRNVPDCGGGGLMDIGCYLITTSRFVPGRSRARVAA